MSGGRFEYKNDSLCYEIFNFLSPVYGIGEEVQKKNAKSARLQNPLEDRILSELVYDVFCLLHSYDWYASGDTSEETYLDDARAFKKKWIKNLKENKEFYTEIVNESIDRLRNELLHEFDVCIEDSKSKDLGQNT